jgi:sec-independent protein translocase protein TatA
MFNVGPTELMVILVLALIVFGPKRLPEMGKSIGKGLREFRKAQTDIRREISQGLNESPTGEGASGPRSESPTGIPGESPTGTPGESPTGTPASDGQGTADQTSV